MQGKLKKLILFIEENNKREHFKDAETDKWHKDGKCSASKPFFITIKYSQ